MQGRMMRHLQDRGDAKCKLGLYMHAAPLFPDLFPHSIGDQKRNGLALRNGKQENEKEWEGMTVEEAGRNDDSDDRRRVQAMAEAECSQQQNLPPSLFCPSKIPYSRGPPLGNISLSYWSNPFEYVCFLPQLISVHLRGSGRVGSARI